MKIWRWVPDVNPTSNSIELSEHSSASLKKENRAQNSLRELLNDDTVPQSVREALKDEFADLGKLLQKLEQEEIHIAVFGRVSVGKSSLLNALMGENHFSVSPLHGETKERAQVAWKEFSSKESLLDEHQSGGVHFIDTPGIDEVDGETREMIARKAAQRADIILFVIDSDMTQNEFQAMQSLQQFSQPLLLILNKSDQYPKRELARLMRHIRLRCEHLIKAENILTTSSKQKEKVILIEQTDGSYIEEKRIIVPKLDELKSKIWHIVENDGATLAALNASLFASDLSDDVGTQVLALRRELANKVITNYSLSKGLAVAANPVPIADLVAAAGLDASMIIHLSRLHGLPMSKSEAGDLLKVIVTQLAALMGTTWAIHALLCNNSVRACCRNVASARKILGQTWP